MIRLFGREITEEEIITAKLEGDKRLFSNLTCYGDFDDKDVLTLYKEFVPREVYRNNYLLKQFRALDKEHPEIRKYFLEEAIKMSSGLYHLHGFMKCFKFKKEEYWNLEDDKLLSFISNGIVKIPPSDLIKRFPRVVPEVGDGYSISYGSDSIPYEVIEVNKTKVKLRAMDYTPADGYDYYTNQVYNYSSNLKGAIYEAKIQNNGRLKLNGEKKFLTVGAKAYRDPSF